MPHYHKTLVKYEKHFPLTDQRMQNFDWKIAFVEGCNCLANSYYGNVLPKKILYLILVLYNLCYTAVEIIM